MASWLECLTTDRVDSVFRSWPETLCSDGQRLKIQLFKTQENAQLQQIDYY